MRLGVVAEERHDAGSNRSRSVLHDCFENRTLGVFAQDFQDIGGSVHVLGGAGTDEHLGVSCQFAQDNFIVGGFGNVFGKDGEGDAGSGDHGISFMLRRAFPLLF